MTQQHERKSMRLPGDANSSSVRQPPSGKHQSSPEEVRVLMSSKELQPPK